MGVHGYGSSPGQAGTAYGGNAPPTPTSVHLHAASGGLAAAACATTPFNPMRLVWRRMSGCLWFWEALPILLPSSPFIRRWNLWTLALMLYVAVAVPLQIGFQTWQHLPAEAIMGWLATASFSMDILINFRTAYMTEQGEVVRSRRLIARRYLRGMLVPDVLAALPFNETLARTRLGENAAWLGLLKLPRLFRLVRHLNLLSRSKYVNLVYVARLLLVMLLTTHWSACGWHWLSELVTGWPWCFDVQCPGCSDGAHYVLAVYRCFLLLIGDRPDPYNNVERLLGIGLLFVGACLYAIVVSSITMLVSNMWSMASRHKQRSTMLQDALRYNGADTELRVRVDEYFNFMASYDHPGPDGVALLSELPTGLHAEVLSAVFEPMLMRVQLFAHCERPFVWRLSQKLRLSLFMAGDVIYELGSVGHDMYIIWKGCVGLVAPGGCMAALLGDGQHFGELGLMAASMPRPHRAVALRPCDVMLLSRWDLQDAMKDFPDSAALVKERARCRMEDHEPGIAVWAAALSAERAQPPKLKLKPGRDSPQPLPPLPPAAGNADAAVPDSPAAAAAFPRGGEGVDGGGGQERSRMAAAARSWSSRSLARVRCWSRSLLGGEPPHGGAGGGGGGGGPRAPGPVGEATERFPAPAAPGGAAAGTATAARRSVGAATGRAQPLMGRPSGADPGRLYGEPQAHREAQSPPQQQPLQQHPPHTGREAGSEWDRDGDGRVGRSSASAGLLHQGLTEGWLASLRPPALPSNPHPAGQAGSQSVPAGDLPHRNSVPATHEHGPGPGPGAVPHCQQGFATAAYRTYRAGSAAHAAGSGGRVSVASPDHCGGSRNQSVEQLLLPASGSGPGPGPERPIERPIERGPSGDVWEQVAQWVEATAPRPPREAAPERAQRASFGLATARSRHGPEGGANQLRLARSSQETGPSSGPIEPPGAGACPGPGLGPLLLASPGYGAAPLGHGRCGSLRSVGTSDDAVLSGELRGERSEAPQVLLLTPQPFLGLDPLEVLQPPHPHPHPQPGVVGRGATGTGLRSRSQSHGGSQAVLDGAAGGGGGGLVSVHSTATGFAALAPPPAAVRFGGGPASRRNSGWDRGASGRGMRTTVQGMSGGSAGPRAAALASDGGASTGRRESIEAWLEEAAPHRCARVAALEQQLATTQAQLEEAQAQVAALLANPFKVAAMAEALRREVEAATARLTAQFDACLRLLLDSADGITGGMEDLWCGMAAVEERLQQLEDEQADFPSPAGAAAGVVPLTLPGGNAAAGVILDVSVPVRVLPEMPPELDGLSRLPSRRSTTGQLGLPQVASVAGGGGGGDSRPLSGVDYGRTLARLMRQQSQVPAHTAGYSSLGSGSDSEAGPGASGAAEPRLGRSVTAEDAALVTATMFRAAGKTSRRRSARGIGVAPILSLSGAPPPGAQPPPPPPEAQSSPGRHPPTPLSRLRRVGTSPNLPSLEVGGLAASALAPEAARTSAAGLHAAPPAAPGEGWARGANASDVSVRRRRRAGPPPLVPALRSDSGLLGAATAGADGVQHQEARSALQTRAQPQDLPHNPTEAIPDQAATSPAATETARGRWGSAGFDRPSSAIPPSLLDTLFFSRTSIISEGGSATSKGMTFAVPGRSGSGARGRPDSASGTTRRRAAERQQLRLRELQAERQTESGTWVVSMSEIEIASAVEQLRR